MFSDDKIASSSVRNIWATKHIKRKKSAVQILFAVLFQTILYSLQKDQLINHQKQNLQEHKWHLALLVKQCIIGNQVTMPTDD